VESTLPSLRTITREPRNLCSAATETFLPRSLAPVFLAPIFLAILALLMLVSQPSEAQRPQLKRPNDDTEDKPPVPKKPVKKVKGPRAVALVQTINGKTTLIPIAILVEGKFYDASEYKADPVPMSLESGTIYEVEQTGTSQGLFTVSSALHSKATNAPHPWVGAGSFLPNGSEAAKTARKAEDVPRGLKDSGDDAPPRLTRAGTDNSSAKSGAAPSDAAAPSAKPTADPKASNKPAANTNAGEGSPSSSASGAGSDKSPPSSSSSESASSATPASSKSSADSTGKSNGSIPATQPSSQDQHHQDPNYYRPTLRRGKPTQTAPTEDEDTAAAPPSTDLKANTPGANSSANPADAKKITPVQVVPAISDDSGPDPRSYKFYWKTGEEEDRRKQMLALAADEVRAYVNALVKNSIVAKPAPKAAVARKSTAKPVEPEFENIRFQGFDVWGNNQPVMILTAEAHMPAPIAAPAMPDSYTITLVTRTDIYGNLHKMYSGVTDKFHLDVTPQLQLIDAVDADGDGRGELLFSETTDAGSGYVIYRATADKLWKLFDSLGGG
jgi:hypothetical protein